MNTDKRRARIGDKSGGGNRSVYVMTPPGFKDFKVVERKEGRDGGKWYIASKI